MHVCMYACSVLVYIHTYTYMRRVIKTVADDKKQLESSLKDEARKYDVVYVCVVCVYDVVHVCVVCVYIYIYIYLHIYIYRYIYICIYIYIYICMEVA